MTRNSILLTIIFSLFLNCDITDTESLSDIEYNTEISIGIESGQIYINLYDHPEIAGFQFDLYTEGGLEINSLAAFGGAAKQHSFTVSTNLSNLRVLGFNLNGETIEASQLSYNTLLYLDIESEGSGLIGIENVILSGKNGYNIPTQIKSSSISLP